LWMTCAESGALQVFVAVEKVGAPEGSNLRHFRPPILSLQNHYLRFSNCATIYRFIGHWILQLERSRSHGHFANPR
jgi:hypothetical protein